MHSGEIVNLWVNRLIGDEQLRKTASAIRTARSSNAAMARGRQPSPTDASRSPHGDSGAKMGVAAVGLLGPVMLYTAAVGKRDEETQEAGEARRTDRTIGPIRRSTSEPDLAASSPLLPLQPLFLFPLSSSL